jgi:hypothetical protein
MHASTVVAATKRNGAAADEEHAREVRTDVEGKVDDDGTTSNAETSEHDRQRGQDEHRPRAMHGSGMPPIGPAVEGPRAVARLSSEIFERGRDAERVVDASEQVRVAGVATEAKSPRHELPSHPQVFDRIVALGLSPRSIRGVRLLVGLEQGDERRLVLDAVDVVGRRERGEILEDPSD